MIIRTLNAVQVGDLFMSPIHTTELQQVESIDYLVALALIIKPPSTSTNRWRFAL